MVVKAPDLMSAAILTAFGMAVTAWLLCGPIDEMMLALSLVLPPLAGYDVVLQCAKAPRGRE